MQEWKMNERMSAGEKAVGWFMDSEENNVDANITKCNLR